jgi:hypothetical protein
MTPEKPQLRKRIIVGWRQVARTRAEIRSSHRPHHLLPPAKQPH